MSNPNWKRFEKLVAAVNKATLKGATVTWNEKINGRQFDVVVRSQLGDLYDYLTVIECKDTDAAVGISDVESFVTKSSDICASKAVMFSRSGFQSGAISVAEKHGIELYSLTETQNAPEELLTSLFLPALSIFGFVLHSKESSDFSFPDRPNECDFFAKHTRVFMGQVSRTVHQIVDDACRRLRRADTRPGTIEIPFPLGTSAVRPDTNERISATKLSFHYEVVTARLAKPETRVDPSVFAASYRVQNERTGQSKEIFAASVDAGWDTKFSPGVFYRDPMSNFAYRCESITDSMATMFLVESYQHGQLIQARMTMADEYARRYIEISDDGEIARLQKMYRRVSGL